MSTDDKNDKRRRFRAVAGGKADPIKSTKSREKQRRSAAKPHIWVSPHGYGGSTAKDRNIPLADLPDSVRSVLEKHLNRGGSDTGKTRKEETACCSFCAKKQDGVKKLIGGPTVYICNECVRQCVGILEQEGLWEG